MLMNVHNCLTYNLKNIDLRAYYKILPNEFQKLNSVVFMLLTWVAAPAPYEGVGFFPCGCGVGVNVQNLLYPPVGGGGGMFDFGREHGGQTSLPSATALDFQIHFHFIHCTLTQSI